ncbi:RNA pseudouridine synthase [Bryobacterales bacterium F-183]|nr:RNA pseudouridine synthase [Bryobacterales bacterium F-183]
MPATDWGWQIAPEELESWIVQNDDRFLVVNKPGLVVCHPSKHGPWSSLIGACREYLGVERLHMPSRLDRETSGVVVLAKQAEWGSKLQKAIQLRNVRKRYLAILDGTLQDPITVDQPIGRDTRDTKVWTKQWVNTTDGAPAQTEFKPIGWRGQYTLAEVRPHTGRLHQIRVHAAWLGCAVAGDKVYGPDENLYIEFIATGWTDAMAQRLPMQRQALHAVELIFHLETGEDLTFTAPEAADMAAFWDSIPR